MMNNKKSQNPQFTFNYAEAKLVYDAMREMGNSKIECWPDVLENIVELRPTIVKIESFLSEAASKIGMLVNGGISFSDPQKNKMFEEATYSFLSNTAHFNLKTISLEQIKKDSISLEPNLILSLMDHKIIA